MVGGISDYGTKIPFKFVTRIKPRFTNFTTGPTIAYFMQVDTYPQN